MPWRAEQAVERRDRVDARVLVVEVVELVLLDQVEHVDALDDEHRVAAHHLGQALDEIVQVGQVVEDRRGRDQLRAAGPAGAARGRPRDSRTCASRSIPAGARARPCAVPGRRRACACRGARTRAAASRRWRRCRRRALRRQRELLDDARREALEVLDDRHVHPRDVRVVREQELLGRELADLYLPAALADEHRDREAAPPRPSRSPRRSCCRSAARRGR